MTEEQEDIIETLELWLKEAKEGKIKSIIMLGLTENLNFDSAFNLDLSIMSLFSHIGALERAKSTLLSFVHDPSNDENIN